MRYVWLFFGVIMLAWPVCGEYITSAHHNDVIALYEKEVSEMEPWQRELWMKEAKEYKDEIDYYKKLDPVKNSVIGWIEIPKIQCMLPIYHGTSEETLEKGVGHLYGSDFPIGGCNTHSLLCGHRGLPNADLFLNLDQLEKGDYFYVNVCGFRLTYQVCSIEVIPRNEIYKIKRDEGKDKVSLITCTPYGINSKRLIVTGERR